MVSFLWVFLETPGLGELDFVGWEMGALSLSGMLKCSKMRKNMLNLATPSRMGQLKALMLDYFRGSAGEKKEEAQAVLEPERT